MVMGNTVQLFSETMGNGRYSFLVAVAAEHPKEHPNRDSTPPRDLDTSFLIGCTVQHTESPWSLTSWCLTVGPQDPAPSQPHCE